MAHFHQHVSFMCIPRLHQSCAKPRGVLFIFLCLYRGSDKLWTCETQASLLLLPVRRGEPKTKDLCTLPEQWRLFDGLRRRGRWHRRFPLEFAPPLLIPSFRFIDAFWWRVINASCFELVCSGLLWYNLLMWLWTELKRKRPLLVVTLFVYATTTRHIDVNRFKPLMLMLLGGNSTIILLRWPIKFIE